MSALGDWIVDKILGVTRDSVDEVDKSYDKECYEFKPLTEKELDALTAVEIAMAYDELVDRLKDPNAIVGEFGQAVRSDGSQINKDLFVGNMSQKLGMGIYQEDKAKRIEELWEKARKYRADMEKEKARLKDAERKKKNQQASATSSYDKAKDTASAIAKKNSQTEQERAQQLAAALSGVETAKAMASDACALAADAAKTAGSLDKKTNNKLDGLRQDAEQTKNSVAELMARLDNKVDKGQVPTERELNEMRDRMAEIENMADTITSASEIEERVASLESGSSIDEDALQRLTAAVSELQDATRNAYIVQG